MIMKYLQNSPLLCVFITLTNIRYKPWPFPILQTNIPTTNPNQTFFLHTLLFTCVLALVLSPKLKLYAESSPSAKGF